MVTCAERAVLLAAFDVSRAEASQRALWSINDTHLPAETCRYCGKFRQRRPGSQLDGHAACVVTDDFKRRVGALFLASPGTAYAAVAEALGVTPGVVRSWVYSAGVVGPLSHALRRTRVT